MIALKFLRRHWGKLLLISFVLWFFGFIDEAVEKLGFNSGRMIHVQTVGRLAPFPLERSHLEVEHSSGMMHDVTTIYFVAKPEVVSRWMQDSPGIHESKPEMEADGTTRYSMWPKGAGVVYVSADRTEVGINLGQALDGPTTNSPIPPRH